MHGIIGDFGMFFVCVTYVRHFDFTLSFRESEVRPSRTSSGGWRNVTATAVRDTPLEHVTKTTWPSCRRSYLNECAWTLVLTEWQIVASVVFERQSIV